MPNDNDIKSGIIHGQPLNLQANRLDVSRPSGTDNRAACAFPGKPRGPPVHIRILNEQ